MLSETYNIDNIEFMKSKPNACFDVGCADPSYGLKQNLKKVQSRQKLTRTPVKEDFEWDQRLPPTEFFSELKRVSVDQIIWGANYFPQIVGNTFKAPRREEYEAFILQFPTGWIIWDKVNGNSDFSDCEIAWTSFDRPTEIFYFMWAGMRQGISATHGQTMQGNKRLNERRIHPTQKPQPLYHWLFSTRVLPGQHIYSPNMGSQSDRLAAYKLGFDFTGNEISKRHFDDGEKRFRMSEPLFSMSLNGAIATEVK